MSDRFNSNEEKTKITNLFNAPKTSEPVETLFPPFFSKKIVKLKASELGKLLTEAKIVTYRPTALTSFELVDCHGLINPGLDELVESYGKVELPVGESEFLPSYEPRHTVTEYDLKMLKQLIYQWIEDTNLDEFEPFIKQAIASANDNVFTSGTYEGQIGRLRGIYDVALGLGGRRIPKPVTKMLAPQFIKECGTAFEAVSKVLEYYLPLNTVEDFMDGGFPGLLYKPSYFANMGEDDFDYLPPIGANKMAGLPYIGKTKKETTLQALVIADSFVDQVASAIASTAPEGNNPLQGYNVPHFFSTKGDSKVGLNAIKNILGDFWYLGAGPLFPKAERYAKADIKRKTRNIFATSFPMHLICALVSNPVMQFSPNTLHGDTPSLYAFSPFHGGMDTFINKIFDAKTSTSWVYADNWYILYVDAEGKKDWYSIDQEKAEGQVTLEDFQVAGYYLLSRGHVTREGDPAFNLTWFYMATTLIPALLHDPTGLLMSQQFLMRGMGSGISWTFLLNHIRSAIIDHKWRNMGMPRPGTKEFDMKVLTPAGCNLKIEMHSENIDEQLLNLKRVTPETGYFQMQAVDRACSHPIPYVGLDLLGWGACYSRMGEQYIAVLEDERFFKSLMLPQKDDNHDWATNPERRFTYQVARCEAMRMVGGWRWGPIDRALQHQAQEARTKLLKMNKLTAESLMDAYNSTEFGSELTIDGVNLVKPIDYLDMAAIHEFKSSESFDKKVEIVNTRRPYWEMKDPAGPIEKIPYPKGISALASMRIDDLLINKDLLGKTLNPKDLRTLLESDEHREAIMELQSFKNFTRNRAELPSFHAIRAKNVEELVNPYVELKIHSDFLRPGVFRDKSQAGPSEVPSALRTKLSKNQRRKQNMAARELPEDLIEGVDISTFPKVSSLLQNVSDKKEKKKLDYIPASTSSSKVGLPQQKYKQTLNWRPRMATLKKLPVKDVLAMKEEAFLEYMYAYINKYGPEQLHVSTVLKEASNYLSNLLREELDTYMPGTWDKIKH